MAAKDVDLSGFPPEAPKRASTPLRFADIAVTSTANEFRGIYRGKPYHEPDFEATLRRARDAGVEQLMLTGMSLADIDTNTAIVRANVGLCSLTMGIHPYNARIDEEDLAGEMVRLAAAVDRTLQNEPSILSAFGELGLDFDRLQHASKAEQIRVFKAQLDLISSKQWDLPLFLHCRAACADFCEIIEPYLPRLKRTGIVHSFVGSTSEMDRLLALGLHISINGFSFQNRESLAMVTSLPLDRLHIETDAPWGEVRTNSAIYKTYCQNMPPPPPSKKRDKWDSACMVKERNESCNIGAVAYVVAGLKGIPVEEVADAAWQNSASMFGW